VDELREIEGAFVTNPVRLEFTNDSPQSLSILSGESIPNNIQCNNIIHFHIYIYLNIVEKLKKKKKKKKKKKNF